MNDAVDLLEMICVMKRECTWCRAPIWYVRDPQTKKLRAFEASGRDHFAVKHLSRERKR